MPASVHVGGVVVGADALDVVAGGEVLAVGLQDDAPAPSGSSAARRHASSSSSSSSSVCALAASGRFSVMVAIALARLVLDEGHRTPLGGSDAGVMVLETSIY